MRARTMAMVWVVTLPLGLSAAHAGPAFDAWARERLVPMNPPEQAFQALDAGLAEVRLIGVGESVHEVNTFLDFRLSLLQHLVRSHRVTALVLESGLPEAVALDDYVRGRTSTVDFEAALPGGLGGLAEVRHAMEWLREWNQDSGRSRPVSVYGADLPATSGSMLPALDLLAKLTPDQSEVQGLLDDLRPLAERVSGAWWGAAAEAYGALSPDEKAALTKAVDRLVARVQALDEADEARPSLAPRLALVAQQFEAVFRLGAFSATAPRDRALAENTLWVLEHLAADEKAVFWAHNAHVQRVPVEGPPLPPGRFPGAGMQFHEKFGERYYAIGTAYGGPALDDGAPATSESVDATLERAARGASLLPLRGSTTSAEVDAWLSESRPMRFQVGHLVLALGKAFDAVAYFDRATRTQRTPGSP